MLKITLEFLDKSLAIGEMQAIKILFCDILIREVR